MRSPTMAACSEWAPILFRPARIITGLGLPTKYGILPVAAVIIAAIDPHAGRVPSSEGPETSGLVAMNFAPPSMRRIARVRAWKS